MANQNWEKEIRQHDLNCNRYLESRLTGQKPESIQEPPDYVNSLQAVKQAKAKLKELGLEQRFEETAQAMSIKPEFPLSRASFQAFAMIKMFREMEQDNAL